MNTSLHHQNHELDELNTTLERFDIFKHTLQPNPEALRAALRNIPLAQVPRPRRTLRIRAFVAALCSATLALVLFFTPAIPTSSPLSDALSAEELALDTPFLPSENSSNSASLDDADATLALLTDGTLL